MKSRAGDFLLDDAPRSGRPAEVDSNQIETLTENNQCSTTWERADTLKISKSMKLLVKMKKCVFYFMEKNHIDFLAHPILKHILHFEWQILLCGRGPDHKQARQVYVVN